MSNLFHQFAAGSAEAFNIYYGRYNKIVYAGLCKLSGDEALAKDLTQDVFKNLWHRRTSLRDETHLINYLFFMARSCFRQHQRRKRIAGKAEYELSRTTEPNEESIELTLVTAEVFAAVQSAMMKLPPQQKMVMELLLLGGQDVGAVAKRMQLAPQTVRNHKSQAIRFLRTQLYSRRLSLAAHLVILLLCFHQL